MRIRLFVLFFLGLVVIIATFFTIFYYRHGINDQYDEYIIRHSLMKNDPELEPVDPAIVKAIISVRTNFTSRMAGNDGEMGLMFIPKDGIERFKDFHSEKDFVLSISENLKDFGLVCPNRNFSNHPDHNQVFSRTARRPCPVCGSRVIEALFDPEINIRVGTWYFAYINSYLRENIEGISDKQALDFSLIIFGNGIDTILADIETQLAEKIKEKNNENVEMPILEEVALRYLKSYMETVLSTDSLTRQVNSFKKEADKFRPNLIKKADKLGIEYPQKYK